MTVTKQNIDSDPITLSACDWVARSRQGLLSSREQARFRRWCEADVRHRAAVEKAEHAWQLAEGLRDDPEFRITARRPVRRRRFSLAVGGAWAAGLALASCWGLWVGTDFPLRWEADYYNGVGEIRRIALPDGSQVELGSRSAFKVRYDRQQRRVVLLKGEAIFSPAPVGEQEARAFVVEAAGAEAKALGTEYLVRLDKDNGLLGVLQHRVELSQTLPQASAILETGESAWFGEQGILPATLRLEEQTSWRKGQLVFRREPLAAVVERLNQYHAGRIVLVGDELQSRQVSAVFALRDLDRIIATLEQDLKVRSLSLPGVTLLY